MKYEDTPRPNIEHHPHIRGLIEQQDKKAADRTLHRDKDKANAEREEIIADAHKKSVMDFWCDECKEDFKGAAILQIEVDWTNPRQRIAFYRMKCFAGHWCIRYITDRMRDPFFFKSRMMRRLQGEHYDDTLQEFQSGFNMLYGRKNT